MLLLSISRRPWPPPSIAEAHAFVVEAEDPAEALPEAIGFLRAARPGRPVWVEIGSLDTPGVERTLDTLMAGEPDGLVGLDCRSGQDVQRLGARLAVREAERGIPEGRTRILAMPGSRPAGLLALGTLAGSSPRLAGLGWNATALATDLGLAPQPASQPQAAPLDLARSLTVIAARAAAVPAFDTATELSGEALRAACLRARHDGFAGKFARDAAQVPIINAAFA